MPAISPDAIETWFEEHGFRVIVIIIVGILLWIIAHQTIPPMVGRIMGRPQKGESREGMRRRANTLKGVFLGLSRIIIILIVVFMVLIEFNVQIGPILAGLGIAGVAIGFGAQYLVRDLIAGIFIIMENQYRVGDVASVGGVTGSVEDINLRKTVLRDLDGIVHHVPNGEIRVASNYSRHFARVNLDISVSYGTDLDYAISVINDVCSKMAEEDDWRKLFRTTPQVLRVNKLGDSGIDIKIIGEVKPLEQWRTMGELRLRIKKEFDRVGIEIPWPHTKLYFGNKPGDES
jgi:small conductance mechanosensitive channel